MQKAAVLLLVLGLSFVSYEKERDGRNCECFEESITANIKGKVKDAVNTAISQLQNMEHTAGNLSSLTNVLCYRCGITVEVLYFNCIYTDPA
jgi:hypothetical protein